MMLLLRALAFVRREVFEALKKIKVKSVHKMMAKVKK